MERDNYLASLMRMPRNPENQLPSNDIARNMSSSDQKSIGWREKDGAPRAQDSEGWRQGRAPRAQDSEGRRQDGAPRKSGLRYDDEPEDGEMAWDPTIRRIGSIAPERFCETNSNTLKV
uniref:Uncharacterized protein n=1 Tax=Anopheles maculatus TaxID=74869 RepID=A0A182T875_9DIPT